MRANIVAWSCGTLASTHSDGFDNKVPQLHTTLSEPLDYTLCGDCVDNKVPQLHETESEFLD